MNLLKNVPTKETIDNALKQIWRRSTTVELPNIAYHSTDYNLNRRAAECQLPSINRVAGCGFPYNKVYSNKGAVIDNDVSNLIDLVATRLTLIAQTPMDVVLGMSSSELYLGGYCDPAQIFLKTEANPKRKKLVPRFIAGVSIADEMVARVLVSALDKAEIRSHENLAQQPGMSQSDFGLTDFLKRLQELVDKGFLLVGTDVSAWDQGTTNWLHFADAERRVGCHRGPLEEMNIFRSLLFKLAHIQTHSIIVTSSGKVFEQVGGGWTKSGTPNTSSTNSGQRTLLAVIAGSPIETVSAMGDDCVELYTETIEANYKSLGFPLKEFPDPRSHIIEFCCHRFHLETGGIERINEAKSLYSLLSKKYDVELYKQFLHEFRHCPTLPRMQEALAGCGWMPANGFEKETANPPYSSASSCDAQNY